MVFSWQVRSNASRTWDPLIGRQRKSEMLPPPFACQADAGVKKMAEQIEGLAGLGSE